MFEKLVVSTAQSPRGRTAKFFACTSFVYLSAAAAAFAISISLSAPKLADSNLVPICIGVISAPAPQTNSVVADHETGGGARQDFSNVPRFEDLIAHPETGTHRTTLPAGAGIRSDGIVGGDPNAPPGSIGVIGGDVRISEPPPQPPDPPYSVRADPRPRRDANRSKRG